jgi:hypothetical protein
MMTNEPIFFGVYVKILKINSFSLIMQKIRGDRGVRSGSRMPCGVVVVNFQPHNFIIKLFIPPSVILEAIKKMPFNSYKMKIKNNYIHSAKKEK